MTTIIGFTGRKQSGKNTMCNYVIGESLVRHEIIDKYDISEYGELLVPFGMPNGEIVMGVMDMSSIDPKFVEYASKFLHPFVKLYSFADPLKKVCMDLLGLSYEQCYGTNEDKATKSTILWENMPDYGRIKYALKGKAPKGLMTAREVMQHIGTEIFRKMNTNCWTDYCINRINADKPEIALVCDCRFPNEADAIKSAGGKLVRLLRGNQEDKHESEVALDPEHYDQDKFDVIIDNKEISKSEAFQLLAPKLKEWLGVNQ